MSLDVLGTRARGALDNLLATLGGMDPFERIQAMRDAGERKARAEGRAYQLDHQRKALLAKLANEYATAHAKENLSEARLERMARADERYSKHLEGTAAAIEERELAVSEYFAVRAELLWLEKTVAHSNALTRMDG